MTYWAFPLCGLTIFYESTKATKILKSIEVQQANSDKEKMEAVPAGPAIKPTQNEGGRKTSARYGGVTIVCLLAVIGLVPLALFLSVARKRSTLTVRGNQQAPLRRPLPAGPHVVAVYSTDADDHGREDPSAAPEAYGEENEVKHSIHGLGNRREEEASTDCVLSDATPFVFLMLVELNSAQYECFGDAAEGTTRILSSNDEAQINNALLTTFTLLQDRYCDPYFRNVTSVEIVRQAISPSSAQPPLSQGVKTSSLTLEVKVLGTLRCKASEKGCNVEKIGLFDLPSTQGPDDGLLQEPGLESTCLCPASNNTTSTIVSNRGPTESEFMEKYGVLLDILAPSLECSDLQVAECAFGSVFQTGLTITFAEPDAAKNATDLIQSEALKTLNDLIEMDGPDLCYPEFRIVQRVNLVFQEARRKLQQSSLTDGTSLFATLSEELLNVSVTPSKSPTSLFDAAPQLTAILSVDGVCSECGSQLFMSNDVSARRRQIATSYEDAMAPDTAGRSRHLQTASNTTAESNCFCPIDSIMVGGARQLSIDLFLTTLQERIGLQILKIQEVGPPGNIHLYPCTNVTTTFKRNVTVELQVACGVADLPASNKGRINLAYPQAYNSLRTSVCDPFNLTVTSANVVNTGTLGADGVSLPLEIEVTVDCFGCDPLETSLYGLPQSLNNDTSAGPEDAQIFSFESDEGTCSCDSTLPRHAPLETDVIETLGLSFLQQEDVGAVPSCISGAVACGFGTGFTSSAILQVAVNDTLVVEPQETSSILQSAYTNALNRLIGGGNATHCNPWFGVVTDTEFFLEFVYNSVERVVNQTAARRQLQDMAETANDNSNIPSSVPTSTFVYSWAGTSDANISDTPTTAPSPSVDDETQFVVIDATGLCNGCPSELMFNNEAEARRRRIEYETSKTEASRFLEDGAREVPESQCFCPIGSVQVVPDLQQVSLFQVLQDELSQLSNAITLIGAVSGLTKVDCVEETAFSTTIDFQFSAFEWVVDNPDDIQGLGDAIAKVYNDLVENFCDEYFRNSISLTYVAGSLQRTTVPGGSRHDRYLQNIPGCFNFHATFNVAGLCRGCQALGTPIPLFGNSTINRRLLVGSKASRQPWQLPRQRGLQAVAGGLTCLCDSTSISQRSAPSLGVVQAGLAVLIPQPLPWAQNPSICGLPVQVEVPCPTIPTGPSTTMTVRFYGRRTDGGCLRVADLQQMAALFQDAFNSNMLLEHFTCESKYLQVSDVIIDPSYLVGCRRQLMSGAGKNDDGESETKRPSRKLLQDFSVLFATMTVTGNIYASNIGAILGGEGATLRSAAASITARSLGVYDIETGKATNTPSTAPSDFPSGFPSSSPSEFPSDEPSRSPPETPSTSKPYTSPSTSKPSSFPWMSPNAISSASPSDLKSSIPSGPPSERQSSVPSGLPSRLLPSSSPSDVKSSIPSGSPSERQSSVPSGLPSRLLPSSSPSDVKSSIPSGSPSERQSSVPSGLPSRLLPSSSPSDVKSSIPSGSPSELQSSVPSSRPSRSEPSSSPSDVKSSIPSGSPSEIQSSVPSGLPSRLLPSSSPSDIKSSIPSGSPSRSPITSKPSRFPSSSPITSEPSSRPSDASCPTSADSCTGKLSKVLKWCTDLPLADACCFNDCFNTFSECKWGGEEATIYRKSCNGSGGACDFGTKSRPTLKLKVEAGSCIGAGACTGIGYSADEISIGPNSCTGDQACSLIGISAAQTISIGKNSCQGNNACNDLAHFKADTVTIGDGSCTKPGSCETVGRSLAVDVKIGAGSCTEADSCPSVGTTKATAVDIGAGSCTAASSCLNVGYAQATKVTIGAGACTGTTSCVTVGSAQATEVTIGGNSCTYDDACKAVGAALATKVVITDNSCDSDCFPGPPFCTDYVDVSSKDVQCDGCVCL